jgi:hypothetical protein
VSTDCSTSTRSVCRRPRWRPLEKTTLRAATSTVLIAAAVNTLIKPIFAALPGGKRMGWRILIMAAVGMAGGAAGFFASMRS